MAGTTLVAVGRDDGDVRQVGQTERKRSQAIGLIAVIIGKEEAHSCSAAGTVKP